MPSSPFRSRLPLPQVPITDEMVCYDVSLPNDPRILEAFEGMVRMLGAWTYWERDPQHKATIAADVFLKLYDRLEARRCSPVIERATGADEGVEQLIRQNPDNPCELQTSIDGTHWCTFADLSLCIPAANQPGSGSEQPAPGGGTACWHAQFTASNKWLLPYMVSAGDTITITNATGAADDGSHTWRCPNGQIYFLGACTGATYLDGSDPAPTIPHARLIAKIGSVYYDAYNTTITVPAGISFANVEFQINDPSLSDNYGDLAFNVCANNNTEATFTHTFDFSLGDGSWFVTARAGVKNGVYVPGLYWNSNCMADAGNYYTGISIERALSSRTINSIEVQYDAAVGTGNAQNGIIYTNTTLQSNVNPMVYGTAKTQVWSGTATGVTSLFIRMNTDAWADNSRCNTGYLHIKRIIVTGLGTDPF